MISNDTDIAAIILMLALIVIAIGIAYLTVYFVSRKSAINEAEKD